MQEKAIMITRFLDWLFNRVSVGSKYRLHTDLFGGQTELIATIVKVKDDTVVYTVSINNEEETSQRINNVHRFLSIYKERIK